MSKVWVDVNDVIKFDVIEEKLKCYDYIMRDIPKHNKRNNNVKKVYELDKFIILKVYNRNKTGFIVYNTNKDWGCGHTHINTFNMAKTIISNVYRKQLPKTKNAYLLESHIRISDNEGYINRVKHIIHIRENKTKDKYINRR